MQILCLGPEGSYGHCVAQWLNENVSKRSPTNQGKGTASIRFARSNHDVLSSLLVGIEGENQPIGIVPVYNTTEGYVAGVMRYLMKASDQRKYYLTTDEYLIPGETLHIVGKVSLRIHHQLLVCDPRVSPNDIKTIISHEQALGQCSQKLRYLFPNAVLEPVSSTSGAAQSVVKSSDPTKAAVASRFCADIYGLAVLVDDVADVEENYTHFYLVAKGYSVLQSSFGSGIALLLWPRKNEPGTLHDILSPMAALNINVRYAPQIPLGGADNKVAFFVEMDTHENPRVMNSVLTLLAEMSDRMIVLGSFINETIIE